MPSVLDVRGNLIFNGKAVIADGCQINVAGSLIIGEDFGCSSGTKIDAKAESEIGLGCSFGHECYLSDDDGHEIKVDGIRTNWTKGYHIGNHVWLGRHVTILKGSVIGDDIVVGACSVVSGGWLDTHTIIAGTPLHVVKNNIDWKR
jgi:acetyltransferase-like isoleucine patch superfamily enzyme